MNREVLRILNERVSRFAKKLPALPQAEVKSDRPQRRGYGKTRASGWCLVVTRDDVISRGSRTAEEAANQALATIFDRERDTFPAKSRSGATDIQLPASGDPLSFFRSQVFESKSITELPDDWDDCGSPSISQEHWLRVETFLLTAAEALWRREKRILLLPVISAVSGGSIDLHWKAEEGELLINVPPSPDEPASFYGDNFGLKKIKGTLELGNDDFSLLLWLRLVE